MSSADGHIGGVAPAPPERRPAPDEASEGARVTIRRGVLMSDVLIVPDDEANPSAGRIGVSSPLARTLSGARRGDVVELHLGGRTEEIAVFAISRPGRGEGGDRPSW